MNYLVIDCEQKSPEWYAARLGRLTGSVASDMQAKIKTGEAAARRNLRVRLALEAITGKSLEDEYQSKDMARGIEREGFSLAAYEAVTGQIVERTGFLSLGPIMAGCSLDGFVDNRNGIVEAKNPKPATHLEYLRTRKIPSDYRWQCVHNLWVTGADYCDFVSHNVDFPEELQYLCMRIERDAAEIRAYADVASQFLAEVAVEISEINSLRSAA
jgi:hypothetical protein